MSTRTQIRFVDESGNRTAQLYKHSDGYPDNVIPMLAELRDVLNTAGWVRGPSYAAAQFTFLDKLNSLRFCAEKLADSFPEAEANVDTDREYGLYGTLQDQEGVGPAKAKAATAMMNLLTDLSSFGKDDRPYFLGGHGVETGNIHGDEEYIYEVTVPTGPHDDSPWRVKVSADFESPEWETISGGTEGYDYGEGEDAWTEASWAYEGLLDDAAAIIEAAREEDDLRDIEALERAQGMKDDVDAPTVEEIRDDETSVWPDQ